MATIIIERDLYSISEAAKRLHMDQAELRNMIFEKKIRIVLRGKRIYVPRLEILRWIDDNIVEYDETADMIPIKRRKKIYPNNLHK